MAKSKKLLIDLCGVIVFFATAFFIMYAVTGKIPFFSETVPEPRRNRRVSYRREKMDEGEIHHAIRAQPRNQNALIAQQVGSDMFSLVYNGCKECLDLIGDVGSGYMEGSRHDRQFDPEQLETLYNQAMEVGGVAGRHLRSSCSKCFGIISAFSQGANREWSGGY